MNEQPSMVLLNLVMPKEIAQLVEDLLLRHPEWSKGFTVIAAEGHGTSVKLVAAAEQVSGHAPRTIIQVAGQLESMQAIIRNIKREFARANIYYWLQPIMEMGVL